MPREELMMRKGNRIMLVGRVFVILLWATAAPALAVQAGITLDVHQDIGPGNQQMWPNDFHVEGLVCSHNGPPTVLQHIDGPFTLFSYTITKINPGDPNDCWYWFEATWENPHGTGYIPYCTVIHLGILFDVDASNIIVDLIGWWTRDGIPIGRQYGSLVNRGYVPTPGFNVSDSSQTVRISNGFLPPEPPLPPIQPPQPPEPPPWPPAEMAMTLLQMDVVPFAAGSPPNFSDLWEGGAQQGYPWVPVVYADGVPITNRPLALAADSFFDIFLESATPPGGSMTVQTPFTIPAGGFLVMREKIQFQNNSGQTEERWFWEIHGAMGAFGACCYGTLPQCVILDQITCEQQLLGQWKGAGTNCSDLNGNGIADICETQALGACCYGTPPQCVVVDQITCEQQYHGVWKGVGTICVDLDGNGIADICEAKWYQGPDLSTNGIDVLASKPLVLADDFLCTKRTLITDIRIWGSWEDDILPPGGPADVAFILSIHADIPDPDGTGPLYSKPGAVLWFHTFTPGSFQVLQYQANINEGWWDPRTTTYVFPGDHVCWEYRFIIPPAEAFCQEGSPQSPVVYWLDVQAIPTAGPAPAQFGWKTSIDHWNDAAVWGLGSEPYPGPWNKLLYPPLHPLQNQVIDLAFALAGDLPCPATCPTCKGDMNGDNKIDGLDIQCFVDCVIGGTIPAACNCACGDMNGDGVTDLLDLPLFINALLTKTGPCP
jgi:hypothetical protein